jgi:hypothetical protein
LYLLASLADTFSLATRHKAVEAGKDEDWIYVPLALNGNASIRDKRTRLG